jgi:hypothetical protein
MLKKKPDPAPTQSSVPNPESSSLSFTIETFDDPETGQPTQYGRLSRNWQDEEALDVLIDELEADQLSHKQALMQARKLEATTPYNLEIQNFIANRLWALGLQDEVTEVYGRAYKQALAHIPKGFKGQIGHAAWVRRGQALRTGRAVQRSLHDRLAQPEGLRSCHEVTVPESLCNAYVGLANHYVARAGIPIKNPDLELAVSAGLKGQVVRQQRQALDTAPFGNTSTCSTPTCRCRTRRATTGFTHSMLSTKLQLAGRLVLDVARRATERFGSNVAIVVASDRGLRRRIWCSGSAFNPYKGMGCEVSSEFLSTRVPPIVVRKGVNPQLPTIDSNRDLFDAMSTSLYR